jgi:preprotein translocase subunit SecE
MNRIVAFLKDVRVEMGKVVWPTRSETLTYTAVVVAVSLALAIYLGLLDSLFTNVLQRIIS